jgi:hypothetical protein
MARLELSPAALLRRVTFVSRRNTMNKMINIFSLGHLPSTAPILEHKVRDDK